MIQPGQSVRYKYDNDIDPVDITALVLGLCALIIGVANMIYMSRSKASDSGNNDGNDSVDQRKLGTDKVADMRPLRYDEQASLVGFQMYWYEPILMNPVVYRRLMYLTLTLGRSFVHSFVRYLNVAKRS